MLTSERQELRDHEEQPKIRVVKEGMCHMQQLLNEQQVLLLTTE